MMATLFYGSTIYLPEAIWLPSDETLDVTLPAGVGITVTSDEPDEKNREVYAKWSPPRQSLDFLSQFSRQCRL
jgi:hypothetical protein